MEREPGETRLIAKGSEASKPVRILKDRYRHCERPFRMAGQVFSCRKCGPCVARMRHDAVGRGIAESYGCDAAFFVTYTIGGDQYYGSTAKNPKAQGLFKPDMQASIKRLLFHTATEAERRGLPRPSLRHFYVGELGDLYARPHYHHLVYVRGFDRLMDFPEECYGQNVFYGQVDGRFDERMFPHIKSDRTWWPWGFVHVKPFERSDVSYLANYVNKPVGRAEDGSDDGPQLMRPGRSTKPFLGRDWFDLWAKHHVDCQLPLHDDGYRLPKDAGFTGRDAVFWKSPTVKRFVGEAYKRHWKARHEADPTFPVEWPRSSLLEWIAESDARRVDMVRFEGAEFFRRMEDARMNERRKRARWRWPEGNAYEAFSTGAATWVDGDYELVRGTIS